MRHKRITLEVSPSGTRISEVIKPSFGTRKTKQASYKSAAVRYAETAKKESSDNEVLVVIAVSAFERYGSNDNGDGFPESACPGVPEGQTLRDTYKTFETKAKVYGQHDYKKPPIGKVLKAFYNEQKHWVELVIELFADQLEEEQLIQIRNNEMINVSMGCDLPFDVCNICLNKAYTDKDYCKHIKEELHDLVDGKIVTMLNPGAEFKDISIVVVGADSISVSVFRKVANLGGKSTALTYEDTSVKYASLELKASLEKLNNIYKGVENFDIPLQDSLRPLFKDAQERISQEVGTPSTPIDKVLLAAHLGVPYPLKKLARDLKVNEANVRHYQVLVGKQLKDENSDLFSLFARACNLFAKAKPEGISSGISFFNLDSLDSSARDKLVKSFEGIDTEIKAAILNIVQKLAIIDTKTNALRVLFRAPQRQNDMQDTILTEYLLDGAFDD